MAQEHDQSMSIPVDQDGHSDESTNSEMFIHDLVSRTKVLLSELEALRDRLRDMRQEASVEVAHFRGTVHSELKMLERLSSELQTSATRHVARSSNLPFLETVWSTAKKSKDLVALQKRFFFPESGKVDPTHANGLHGFSNDSKGKRIVSKAIIIDAITDGGRTWSKVSLVTNTRLLFDLAKQGWDSGGSDDDNESQVLVNGSGDYDTDVPLLRTAKELTLAAKTCRVRTKHPIVHLVLPRVQPGELDEIDAILDDCRAAGALVFCGEDITPSPPISEVLPKLILDPITDFSDTLNIDCTILLALVSEFSHAKVSKEPWFHYALQRQVEIEDNENLLPALLYPAMGSRKLVCTTEASKRMREIVDTIGTPSEKARTAILMGDDKSKSQADLAQDMQAWSAYTVPAEWQLPIGVVSSNEDDCQATLPNVATKVAAGMTTINNSVFLHGWATRRTTITSNRTVVKKIEGSLERLKDLDDAAWPKIWLCPTARSLVGREKRGVKADETKAKAWPLPDPLRREQQRRHGLDVLSMREGCEVQDLRPDGYPSDEVIAAKNSSKR